MKLNRNYLLIFYLFCVFLSYSFLIPADLPDQKGLIEVQKFMNESEFPKCSSIVKAWVNFSVDEKQLMLDELVKLLPSRKKTNVVNTGDTVVMSRLKSGEMKLPGHGLILRQDLFIEGGKAAWAIENILSVELPTINEEISVQQLSENINVIKQVIQAYKNGVSDVEKKKVEKEEVRS